MNIQSHINNLKKLEQRNDNFLHITAYENILSRTASQFLDSPLSNRYYFGAGTSGIINWNPFTCLGLPAIEELVTDAESALCKMLKADIVNLRCLTGVHAMMCAILVATDPEDTVMIVHHDDGGHFSTEPILNRTGRTAVYATYDSEKLEFNIEKTARTYHESRCRAIYLDISYVTTPVNLTELRAALGHDAVIIYDASHTIGLMMGGEFQSPFEEGADIICANTHKTLPGPHKGLIAFKHRNYGDPLNDTISRGLFSTSQSNQLIALSISILEMQQYGHEYARQVINNSNALAAELVALNRQVRSIPGQQGRYSETHQIHMYLSSTRPAIDYYRRLVENNISTNFDNRIGGNVFARLGTQELTRHGLKEADMKDVAHFIDTALNGVNIADQVAAYANSHTGIFYSFDDPRGM